MPETISTNTANPNVLIQQSLQATRVAQSLKKAEQRLEQERVWEVLKSSNPSNSRLFQDCGHFHPRINSCHPHSIALALQLNLQH